MVGKTRAYGYFMVPAVGILIVLTLVPIALLVTFALTSWNLNIPNSFRFAGLGNWGRLFQDNRGINSILVSCYYIFVNTSVQVIFGFVVAYLLFTSRKGGKVLRPILLVPMLIPPVVVGLCWRVLFTPGLGGINYFIGLIGIRGPDWLGRPLSSLIAVTIASVWEWTPFVMLVLLAGLESLPKDPIEAAIIDGTSQFQRPRCVLLPLLPPVLGIVVVLRVIDALGNLPVVYMLTGGGPHDATDALNLYAYNVGFNYLDIAYGSTLLVTFIFIMLIFSLPILRTARQR